MRFSEVVKLQRARDFTIDVLDGRVWITDGRSGDIFLERGASYRVEDRGVVLVEPDRPNQSARIALRGPPGRSHWHRLVAGAAGMFDSLTRGRGCAAISRDIRDCGSHTEATDPCSPR